MRIILKFLKRLILLLILIVVVVGFIIVNINLYVQNKENENILCAITESKETLLDAEVEKLNEFNGDCILILGAGIKDKDTPTPMLRDRLDVGIMLYRLGVAPKILLTGDNGQVDHNEIHVMLKYCKDAGVPSEDIFCDHAGFSTYDSMYRAGSIFQVKKAIVVTQTYHEYRALYLGEKLGLEVIAVSSDQDKYKGQHVREMREVLARNKDFIKAIYKPESTLGGEPIPISGDGTISHGE